MVKPEPIDVEMIESESGSIEGEEEEIPILKKKETKKRGPKPRASVEVEELSEEQWKRIKLLKDFYAGKLVKSQSQTQSQSQSQLSEQYEPQQEDEDGDRKFALDFQISWYLNESVAYFPDCSSVPEESFSIKRDRNLWFLCKENHPSYSNDRPHPGLPVGSQAEATFDGPTRDLHLLIRHVINRVFKERSSNHIIMDSEFGYDVRDNKAYSLQRFTVPAHMSKVEAIDAFVQSDHEYLKSLPPGYESSNARKGLIYASRLGGILMTTTTLAPNVSINIPKALRDFSLAAIKVFFKRTKENHEFRVFFDTTFLEVSLKDVALFKALGAYFKDNLKIQLSNPELGNTLEFVPRTPETGFKLQLYDYQKRSLQWMYQVEKKENSVSIIKRGETAHLARFDAMPDTIINFSESTLLDRPSPYYEQVDYTCLGGVLADNPGYGKTITTLALIHSNPLDSFTSLPMTPVEKFFLFPSRATLIVCPANLVKQWQAEVEKCLPKTVRCYIVSWIIDHRKLSWNDVMQADIIIISVGFLANMNYHKFLKEKFNKPTDVYSERSTLTEPYFAPVMRKIIPARKTKCDELGVVNFEAIYWHRIVFDEFHELDKCEKNSRGMAKAFRGLFHWGMTGTPAFKSVADIKVSAEFLSIELDSSESSSLGRCLSFKANYIRRNNEDLELPPLTDEIEWITLTPPEKALYSVRSSGTEVEMFMACSHYQISDEVVSATGDEILSIEKVSELLCDRLVATCSQMELNIEETKTVVSQIRREINRDNFDIPSEKQKAKRDFDRESENLKIQQSMYQKKVRELDYFRGVMNALEKDSLDESCLICLDELKLESEKLLCVTKCGHVFCVECVDNYLLGQYPNPKVCPKCREIMKREEIMRVDPKAHLAEKEKKKKDPVDVEQLAKCGSKISAMIKRLKKIRGENPSAKVILFCQFRRLANIIYSTLTDNGVSVARVHGSHSTRNRAINEFKSNPECSVIMLSTEDSVSGLHLPEASHIFITHPFWFGSGRDEIEKAISAEKQGIARAHRLGLQHPLKVIRFYTKDTIEETVSKDRTKV